MKILVLNGSPKGSRSNTYRLTKAFVDGIAQADPENTAVDTVEVSKLSLKPCLGCFACWNKTPGKCCIQDDMAGILSKMLWADVTVWSFPLYYFGIPGQLKNLMDRQLPLSLPFMSAQSESGGHPARYDMSGKKTVVISTCGFYTPEGNYDGVKATFDHLCGKGNYTTLFCGQGELFRVKELAARTDEYLSHVQDAGREYALSGISAATREKLNTLLYPREVFEAMADASWGIADDGSKADDSLVFTRQMAALYNKAAYPGKDIRLEMRYTDLGKTYYITLTAGGSTVSQEPSGPYTTRISTPFTVWQAIAAGEIGGAEAMMKQMYQVEGDFDLMLHWDSYFGSPQPEAPAAAPQPQAKTDMNILLAPWITFWIAAAIHAFYGSLISLGVCLIVPLVFFRSKKTFYDVLSAAGVGGCSVALLLGAPAVMVVPVSYLLFGLMWGISCFTAIPLTAHYSMNEYGMDAALKNPIFMRTNRILTAAWSVLYLLTPIWTYLLMQTSLSSFVGAINSVLPALMGIFTGWFQKWYPRHIASGK